MARLQRNIVAFTQRLHTAEVERRSLRMEVAGLRQDNRDLGSAKDRARSMEDQLTQLRESVSCLSLERTLELSWLELS